MPRMCSNPAVCQTFTVLILYVLKNVPTLTYLFFFFFLIFLSFSRFRLAISITSLASFSGTTRAGEKGPGPPKREERVEARDKLFLRFSHTASLSRSLALKEVMLSLRFSFSCGCSFSAKPNGCCRLYNMYLGPL